MPFRFLTEDDVRAVLPSSRFPELVDLMEAALRDFSEGRVVQPVRAALPVGPPGQYLGVMPAALPGASALGAKLVSVVPDNARRALSTHIGVVVLFDTTDGQLLAIMDARYITEVRTAAVSAVSLRWMARPDASRLAVVGTGVQARSHTEVFASCRRLSCVRAWGPEAPQLAAFAAEMSTATGAGVEATGSAEEAVRGADIVVLATSSDTPVVRREWVSPGAHVVSVGACRPHQREMDPALLAASRLVVDSRDAALVESGDVVMSIAEGHFGPGHLAGELGEVAAGKVPGRVAPGEITVFKSLGMAVEDVVTGGFAWREAVAAGLGRELTL
jgi:ornithine cyclodeaminase